MSRSAIASATIRQRREYYAMHGRELAVVPARQAEGPAPEYLDAQPEPVRPVKPVSSGDARGLLLVGSYT
jgi:hypothetical protein